MQTYEGDALMAREIHASYESKDNQRKALIGQGWTYKEAVRNASYASAGTSYAMYNAYLNLACCSMNVNMSTLPTTSGVVILEGFPKPRQNQHVSMASQSNRSFRGYINTSGQLIVDVVPSSVGWYAGSVTYPYTAL